MKYIHLYLGIAICTVGCGNLEKHNVERQSQDESTKAKSATTPVVNQSSKIDADGFLFTIPKHNSIQSMPIDYEGIKQTLIAIKEDGGIGESDIWVATKPCELARNDIHSFKESLKNFSSSFLEEGLKNGGFELLVDKEYALEAVPKTSDSQNVFGYFFNYIRTYHQERMERIVILSDFRSKQDLCARIKVYYPVAKPILPSTLTGKTLIEIQKSFEFKNHN